MSTQLVPTPQTVEGGGVGRRYDRPVHITDGVSSPPASLRIFINKLILLQYLSECGLSLPWQGVRKISQGEQVLIYWSYKCYNYIHVIV